MKKFHTGYYLTFKGDYFTKDEYSDNLIKESQLKLITSNYKGKDWEVEWVYSSYWNGLEFVICARTFDIAQNVLFNVLCAESVVDGTLLINNEPHYPHEFGTISSVKGLDLLVKPVKGCSNNSVPLFFKLVSKSSNDKYLSNAIVKYQLSTEIYSKNYMDLNEVVDWKTTNYNYLQIRFAYAIITAYSVIEELDLSINVNVSSEKSSKLKNGSWNPEVLEDIIKRLKSSNINVEEDFVWMIRGDETEIERKKPINVTKRSEWADPPNIESPLFIKINDGYVYLPDAINYISFLRSSISSHRVGDRINNLSIFDVANAQHLARRLILEKTGLWNIIG